MKRASVSSEEEETEEGEVVLEEILYGKESGSLEKEEESSEDEMAMKAVLPIDTKFNPNNPPQTGEEYLRIVQLERQELPHFVYSPKDATNTAAMVDGGYTVKEVIECVILPVTYSSELVNKFNFMINTFSTEEGECEDEEGENERFNEKSEMPKLDNEESWLEYLKKTDPHSPSTTISPLQLSHLIRYFSRWIEKEVWQQNEEWFLLWIMRVLIMFDQRVTPNEVALLRKLAYKLRKYESSQDCLFIVNFISRKFSQSDLLYKLG